LSEMMSETFQDIDSLYIWINFTKIGERT
jgi:hypothetical protein